MCGMLSEKDGTGKGPGPTEPNVIADVDQDFGSFGSPPPGHFAEE
jgi:hypothetical protein